MKIYFLAIGVTAMVTACNTDPKAIETATILPSDSIFVLQPELPAAKEEATTTVRPIRAKASRSKEYPNKQFHNDQFKQHIHVI